ncbi:MAG: response regulator [Oscillochloris sp.]|nr:response regulator [Oscillochloris sp.]
MATILIVDDYAPNHRLMSFVLEQHGYAVISAFDGFQALERLAANHIDLVLTDLTMPKMGGLDLTRAIRADSRFVNTPIIVVTASTREHDHVHASGIGVNAFLTKPVDSDDLIHEVARLVAHGLFPGSSSGLMMCRSGAV